MSFFSKGMLAVAYEERGGRWKGKWRMIMIQKQHKLGVTAAPNHVNINQAHPFARDLQVI